MIGPPFVENRMQQGFVVEVSIAAVDGEPGRWDRDEEGARTAPRHCMASTGGNDDDLVPEA